MQRKPLSIIREGHGEPIILLHGWGMHSLVFSSLSTELAKTREVIRVDLPGYGGSVWDPGLSFSEQAAQIAAVLPAGDILGWSMGGLFATEMLRQQPQQFNRLLLVCSNPCFVRRVDWYCAVDAMVFDAFADSLLQDWQATLRRFLSLQMQGNEQSRQLIRQLIAALQISQPPHLDALRFGLQLLKQQDMRSVLSTFERPIKMILGCRDTLVPKTLGVEICHINPNIEVKFFATAAHVPFLSHAAQFRALL